MVLDEDDDDFGPNVLLEMHESAQAEDPSLVAAGGPAQSFDFPPIYMACSPDPSPEVETPLEVVGAFAVQVTPLAKRVKRNPEEEKAHQRVLRLERDRKRRELCPLSDGKQIALLKQRLEIAIFERDFAVRIASDFSHDAACFHRLVSLKSHLLMHAYGRNAFLPLLPDRFRISCLPLSSIPAVPVTSMHL